MKTEIYNEIITFAEQNLSNHLKSINELCSKYPQFKRSTFISILNQEIQRKVKKSIHFHTSSKKANEYYSRYLNEVGNNIDTILKMSAKIDLSPCLLARIILEKYLTLNSEHGVNKKDIGRFMKEPQLINDPQLHKNIQLCIHADKFYGPIADVINRSAGHEYEVILKQKLTSYDIPFHDETYLRSRGYDKTPDVVLQLPIAVKNKVINWMESKALFGDVRCHERYALEQYSTYNNRFGPGLVIYWLGYCEDLETLQSKHLTIVDAFPDDFVALNVAFG